METFLRLLILSMGASAVAIILPPPLIVSSTGSTASLLAANQSLRPFPVNDLKDYAFTCSGPTYGFFQDADVSSCLDATRVIAAGRERIRFAKRDTAEVTPDSYPLPWRWMDRRSSQFQY